MHVAVVGGSVAGLGAALALGRDGHQVTLLEQDPVTVAADADAAFADDRRGAPQVRHSHGFLARLRLLLRDEHPDVLAALLAAGATEMRFGEALPPELAAQPIEPDDDLVMLGCRRTTFEWVLRTTVSREPTVELVASRPVTGLVASGQHVTGVRTVDGTELAADLVVLATGRRGDVPGWFTAIGAGPVPESVDDTGIVYMSRWYRLRPDASLPPRDGVIGGDLGYLKYGVFVGDHGTFSVTLACPVDDVELRRTLASEAGFDAAAASLQATRAWVDADRAEPTGPVHVMAGLVNRIRHFSVDGRPLATGVQVIGDARLSTNPLYGRGCTTGLWSALLLARAVREVPADPAAQVLRFEALVRDEIEPHHRSSVMQDAEARRVAAALLAGEDPDDPDDPRSAMRGVFRDGLLPAMRSDLVVMRAVFRGFNLLDAPEALMADPDVVERVMRAYAERDDRPPAPVLGPATRAELLALVG